MFDCSFTRPPSDKPPVKIAYADQKLMVSNNQPAPVERLVQKAPATAKVYVIPPGKRGGVVKSAQQRFFRDTATASGKIFDTMRDFGAKADGRTDDTAAIQATIDAARNEGHGAMAYLPIGHYVVKKPLKVTGSDYTVSGDGFATALMWQGEKGLHLIDVIAPQDVTLQCLSIGGYKSGDR